MPDKKTAETKVVETATPVEEKKAAKKAPAAKKPAEKKATAAKKPAEKKATAAKKPAAEKKPAEKKTAAKKAAENDQPRHNEGRGAYSRGQTRPNGSSQSRAGRRRAERPRHT